jgi:hypothetical protein
MRGTTLSGLLLVIMFSSPAQAEYTFQIISHPDAVFTQVFGVNNAGKVVGIGYRDDALADSFTFVYDMKRGTFTTVSEDFDGIGINNSGALVGGIGSECATLDKKGNVTNIYPPSTGINTECQGRGVNSRGNVTGYVFDNDTGFWNGFVYDPKDDTYEEFLPSPSTIANGINAAGQVVGHVGLFPNEAYPASPPGRYGFLRQKDGSEKLFEISQAAPGWTHGRGISESGWVTGWFREPVNFDAQSFVTRLSDDNEFEEVTLAPDEILFFKPCTDATPGPDYVLDRTDVYAQQIRNDGVVVGSCADIFFDPVSGDYASFGYGFIATPPSKSKKK